MMNDFWRSSAVAFGFVLASISSSHAQFPTTRPSAVEALSLPSATVDPKLGLITPEGETVRVLRDGPGNANLTSGIAVWSPGKTQPKEWSIPALFIRGLTPFGPGRVLVWGEPRVPAGGNAAIFPAAQVVDLQTGEAKQSFDTGGPIAMAAVSADGLTVLSCTAGGVVRWFDSASGRERGSVGLPFKIGAVTLGNNGRLAAFGGGSGDEIVHVWDLTLNREIARGQGHRGPISSVSFSKDGKTLLTSSLDGSTRLWSTDTAREIMHLRLAGVPVVRATFSPDEGRVLTTLGDHDLDGPERVIGPGNQLRLWEVSTGRELLRLDTADAIAAFAGFSTDGKQIQALVGLERWAWPAPLTDAGSATAPASQPTSSPVPSPGFFLGGAGLADRAIDPTVRRVGFLKNGDAYLVRMDRRVDFWDVGRRFLRGSHGPNAMSVPLANVFAVSSDGRLAASGITTGGNQIVIWDIASGLPMTTISLDRTTFTAASLSDDGMIAILVTPEKGEAEKSIAQFYRTLDGSAIGSIAIPTPASIALTPDGNRLTVATRDPRAAVQEFDLDTARRLITYAVADRDEVASFAYSNDGGRLVAVAGRSVYVWETKTATRLLRTTPQATVTAVSLSPDGKKLITGGADSNVRVFDLATRKAIGRFDEAKLPIESLAVSPDGKWIVAASREQGAWVFPLP